MANRAADILAHMFKLADAWGWRPPPSEGAAVARRTRRFWSKEEKRRIVAQSYTPGISASVVARRYDVNANLIFT